MSDRHRLSLSHTLDRTLKSTVSEWELDMTKFNNNPGIAVVTDNARNMGVAVKEAGLSPHNKVFRSQLKTLRPRQV